MYVMSSRILEGDVTVFLGSYLCILWSYGGHKSTEASNDNYQLHAMYELTPHHSLISFSLPNHS